MWKSLSLLCLLCLAANANQCPFSSRCDCTGINGNRVTRAVCQFDQCETPVFNGPSGQYIVVWFSITGCVGDFDNSSFAPFKDIFSLSISAGNSFSSLPSATKWPAETFKGITVWSLELNNVTQALPPPPSVATLGTTLRYYSVSGAEPVHLPALAFEKLPLLTQLTVQNVNGLTVDDRAFQNVQLDSLTLNQVRIDQFPSKALSAIGRLNQLDVFDSAIGSFQPAAFAGISGLTALNLIQSDITPERLPISEETFDRIPIQMQQLTVDGSTLAEFPKSFAALKSLTELTVGHGQISSLRMDDLPPIVRSVFLTKNPIETIVPASSPISVKILHMTFGTTETVDLALFDNMPKLDTLVMDADKHAKTFRVSDVNKVPLQRVSMWITNSNLLQLDQSMEAYLNRTAGSLLVVSDCLMECKPEIRWMRNQVDVTKRLNLASVYCSNDHSLNVVDYLQRLQ